jgi:hypothetical protein
VDFLVLTQLAAACTAELGILAAIINPVLNAAGLIKNGGRKPNTMTTAKSDCDLNKCGNRRIT